MKTYWDSSALVQSVYDPAMKQRFQNERGFTRTHSLAETFSALTANPATRLEASHAAKVVDWLAQHLDFVDLSAAEITQALHYARRLGVRGGRVHDYLHALAAEKGQAGRILTLDRHDFADLTTLTVEQG